MTYTIVDKASQSKRWTCPVGHTKLEVLPRPSDTKPKRRKQEGEINAL